MAEGESPAVVVLPVDDALRLRTAFRAERDAKIELECRSLELRVQVLEAEHARITLFEAIADRHGFNAAEQWEFDEATGSVRRRQVAPPPPAPAAAAPPKGS